MSLGSALNAAVSGLKAQSAGIAAVSENIANASTTAYKNREISFESLVTGQGSGGGSLNQVGGGVLYSTSQSVSSQGLIENTGVSTNIAINGSGFFVVASNANDQPSAYMYTRNGDFKTNEDGLLINNEGMILLGQRTDENGDVTAANSSDLNSLVPIDLNTISGTAGATTEVAIDINLPANGDVFDTVTQSPEYITAYEVFDNLGTSLTIEQTVRKTGTNTWVIEYADPYETSDASATPLPGAAIDIDSGTAGVQKSVEVTFNGDGSIGNLTTGTFDAATGVFTAASASGLAASLDVQITGLSTTTGANDLAYTMDLGTSTLFDGLTQFASNESPANIEISSIEQNGVRFGKLSGVQIDSEGLVTALFDNGVRRPIYQIPIATFPNPEGLTNVGGTIYDENENAGNYNLNLPSDGNAGSIEATSIELSTVDTSEEFNKMIVAQQAYSSAAQILSTVSDMFDTLVSSVR